jgi:DNA (cytosine-5)-methyltransferase 1
MFVMENVLGLLGKRGRPLIEGFLARMANAGYETEAHVVNAAEYGVPQVRKRVIVVGWRKRDVTPFVFPAPRYAPGEQKTVQDAIGDLPTPSDVGQLGPDPLHKKTRLSPLNQERLKHIPPGGGMEHLPVSLRVDCHKGGADRIGHRYVYGRLAADRPAATITARFDSFTRGRFAHPTEDRNITLREGARLQTFPDDFRFWGNQEDIAAQIGNAVPPALAETLAAALLSHLNGESGHATHPMGQRIMDSGQISLFARGE